MEATNKRDDLVLVTGGSGYIATHVVQLLQKQGYRVRATVRSLKNETKVKPLRELCPDAQYPLELVEADLLHEESWIPAVKGCTYVIHIASPLPTQPTDNEDEIIKPAVNGTLAVLKACGEGVKRVVVTSACAVTAGSHDQDASFTEDDWTDIESAERCGPYCKSKVLAEKLAWQFVENLPDDRRFELAVVNPGGVVGPVLCGGFSTSMDVLCRVLQPSLPGVPKLAIGVVDVRDVALAHVNAMTIPEAAGHRHILVAESMSFKQLAEVLDEEFRPQGYNVYTMEVPNFIIKFASLFDKLLCYINPLLGIRPNFDNTRMKSVLAITPRKVKDSLTTMAYSMIELGHIKKTDKYTGPRYLE